MRNYYKKISIKKLMEMGVALALIFAVCLVVTACSASNEKSVNNNSNNEGGKINYKVATISKVEKDRRGIVEENNGTFLYDENGNLLKNYFYKSGNDYYYSNKDGKIVYLTYVVIDARTKSNVRLNNTEAYWYYFGPSGKAMRGTYTGFGSNRIEFDNSGKIISGLPNDLKHKEQFDLSDKNVGDIVIFGAYEEKSNGEYAYLSWDLLDKKDDKVLLATCYIVDEKKIGENYKWSNSELRTWLNNHFLNWAFKKEKEYDKVCETKIITDGETTKDKIFLLSEDEVEKYYKNDLSEYKVTLASGKVLRKGLYCESEMSPYSPYCLRDSANGDIKIIGADGKVYLSKDYNWYLNEVEKEKFDAYIESVEAEESEYKEMEENLEDDGDYGEIGGDGRHYTYDYRWRDYNVYGIRPAVWLKIK